MATKKDTDWFQSDAAYRNAAGREQANLYDTLSGLMNERNTRYRQLDNARDDWKTNRKTSTSQSAADMAARGLTRSGIAKQGLDKVLTDYQKQENDINAAEQETVQQYGDRNSMAGKQFTMDSIADKNYSALASMYGLLGQRGVSAGNAYNSTLAGLRNASAGRSSDKIINTLGW